MVLTYKRYPNKDYHKFDNFYGSTQSRLKTYTSDRRVEEHNGNIQQAKVYQKLAEERGDIETADKLSKLANVFLSKVMDQEPPEVTKMGKTKEETPLQLPNIRNLMVSAIKANKLATIWEAMKSVPKSELSKTAQILQHDLKKNKILKDIINEKLSPILQKKFIRNEVQGVVDSIINDITGGIENVPALEELASKAATKQSQEIADIIDSDEGYYTAHEYPASSRKKSKQKKLTTFFKKSKRAAHGYT